MLSWLQPGLSMQHFPPELLRLRGPYQGRRAAGPAHMFCFRQFPANYGLDDFTQNPKDFSSTPRLQPPTAPRLSAVQPLELPTPSI